MLDFFHFFFSSVLSVHPDSCHGSYSVSMLFFRRFSECSLKRYNNASAMTTEPGRIINFILRVPHVGFNLTCFIFNVQIFFLSLCPSIKYQSHEIIIIKSYQKRI